MRRKPNFDELNIPMYEIEMFIRNYIYSKRNKQIAKEKWFDNTTKHAAAMTMTEAMTSAAIPIAVAVTAWDGIAVMAVHPSAAVKAAAKERNTWLSALRT